MNSTIISQQYDNYSKVRKLIQKYDKYGTNCFRFFGGALHVCKHKTSERLISLGSTKIH